MRGVPFRYGFFGSAAKVAEFLNIEERTARTYKNNGWAPKKFSQQVLDMGKLLHFPVDEPPPPGLIGKTAHLAWTYLLKGRPREAFAAASSAFAAGVDWESGEPLTLTPLGRACCDFVYAIALGRSGSDKGSQAGLKLLAGLRVKYRRQIKQPQELGVWRHLDLLSINYSLVRIGLRHYESRLAHMPKYRKRVMGVAREALSFADEARLDQPFTAALVAWDVGQFAVWDNAPGLLIEAIDLLQKVYSRPGQFDDILYLLEHDDVVGPMMACKRVRDFVARPVVA